MQNHVIRLCDNYTILHHSVIVKTYYAKEVSHMLKRAPTAFGIAVKTRLLELGQTQEWLIAACRERTGMYVDSSTMYKLLTGQLNSYRLEAAVRDILNIPSQDQQKPA